MFWYLKHQTSTNIRFCITNRHKLNTKEYHSFGDHFILWAANFTEEVNQASLPKPAYFLVNLKNFGAVWYK